MSESSPCQHCGACCAHFRVTFYWAEADDAPGGTVPVALTHQQSPTTRCMQGTDTYQPHCIALEGEVGCAVSCRIYEARPSPCREVMPGDAHCTRARAAWGLSPLDPPAPGRAA